MSFVRNPEIRVTDVEGEFFLVEPESGQIFYLDRIASGLWRLLDRPQEEGEILATFREAFPEEPPERLEGEVAEALQGLVSDGLVRRAG